MHNMAEDAFPTLEKTINNETSAEVYCNAGAKVVADMDGVECDVKSPDK